VKAEHNYAAGERVLTIPNTMLVTARQVRSTHALKPVFHAFPKTADDDVLAVFLMYERQVAERNGTFIFCYFICFVLFCFVLFCFVLFCFVLFCFIFC
jgi:hypothetical protein